jgi:hypothetical protein
MLLPQKRLQWLSVKKMKVLSGWFSNEVRKRWWCLLRY